MKVTANSDSHGFKPVEVTLTFESESELECFYAVFNFRPVTNVCFYSGLMPDLIRDSIEEVVIRSPANSEWHTRLCEELK